MEQLLDVVGAIASQAAERLPDGDGRRRVLAIRRRLDEPLRVAVAGRVSAGKSTLVNALLAQRVVPVGAGECTRLVTWLRYGDVDEAHAVLVTGERHAVALAPDRSLPLEVGVDPGLVDHLDVRLYNGALDDMTLIDTTGLESLTPGVSRQTTRLLGLGTDDAVAEVDALIYVVSGDLRDDDERAIADFSRHAELAGATAANTVLVVTKVDRVLQSADEGAVASMLDRWRARLGKQVFAVTPVIGLLAETALSGALDEPRAAALAGLARVDRAERERWLASSRRFLADATVPGSAEERADLLRRLDVFGLRRASELAGRGVEGAAALTRELGAISGVHALRSLLSTAFTARAALLKADAALHALRAFTEAPDTPTAAAAVVRESLMANADRLVGVPEAQRLRELDVLRDLATGSLALPEPFSADVHRLATGSTVPQRLGLPGGASPADMSSAAVSAAARWRRFGFDARRTGRQRHAAHVVSLSLARIARELQVEGAR